MHRHKVKSAGIEARRSKLRESSMGIFVSTRCIISGKPTQEGETMPTKNPRGNIVVDPPDSTLQPVKTLRSLSRLPAIGMLKDTEWVSSREGI
jgi:hypothetical protein